MLVRSLNKEFFEFRPTFKLVLSGNHKPEIGGVDHGIWRRVKFVPWPVTIADHERRPMDEVMAEIWPERSGILNWLIAGALDYLNGGLRTPPEVIEATAAAQWHHGISPLTPWINVPRSREPAHKAQARGRGRQGPWRRRYRPGSAIRDLPRGAPCNSAQGAGPPLRVPLRK
jgi:phage/plasmid-associated DNA primase